MVDADELQRSAAARFEIPGDRVEIGAPPALTDCFDHLDRGDRIKLLRGFAIVLQADFDLARKPGSRDPLVRPRLLLLGQGQADDLRAPPCGLDCETSPAAADLEQALPRFDPEPVEQSRNLPPLRILQAIVRTGEAR